MNETHLPITGICLVAKAASVPTGYQCIRKTFDDTNRDADLMADSILERKDRFLCITRLYPLTDVRTLSNDRALVLEDIKLINERDTAPASYTALTYTIDTREKGTAKKLICVKMTERQAGIKCICDIVFLYRSKRPPQLYTLIGDINGLQMCTREGVVPTLDVSLTTANETQSKIYPNPLTGHVHQQTDYSNTSTLTKKADEKEFLDGIPFEINSKYLNHNRNQRSANSLTNLDSFRTLSPYEIDDKFNYTFTTENAVFQ